MKLDQITPLILTFNEESNIEACLKALSWASNIVVIDSGSSDRTTEIVSGFDNATLHVRPFDNHTAQWNYGLDMVGTTWVLTLDADYVCHSDLADELEQLPEEACAYQARFRYCVFGYPLRGTLYPPRVVLFPAQQFRYQQDGHTQLLDTGAQQPKFIRSILLHNDLKPLRTWLESQARYAKLEADKLHTAERLGWKDRIRKAVVFAPALTLLYCLFWKGLIWDGWKGINYSLQRVYAELLLSLNLLDQRLRSR